MRPLAIGLLFAATSASIPSTAIAAEPAPSPRAYDGPMTGEAPADGVAAPQAAQPTSEAEPRPEPRDKPAAEAEVPADEAPLEDEDGEAMTRTVVVGSLFRPDELPRIVGSAHQIDERQLEKHEHDDIHKILDEVPGVYVRGEDGFGLRPNIGLRGANSDRSAKVTLMEDGVLMGPAPYAAPAAYYFPLATRMVGVEVFKGAASVRHGPNTIGGALNMRTREIPDDHKAMVDLAAGRFRYGKAHAYYGTTYKGFGVLIEAARVQTRGFKDLDGGGDTGFGKNDAMIKLGYKTAPGRRIGHVLELKTGFANERSFETYLGLSDSDFGSSPYRRYAASARGRMTWWRSQAEVAYVVTQNETVELETRLYRHDFQRTWRRLNRFRNGPDLSAVLANPDAGQFAVLSAILRGEEDTTSPDQALMVTQNNRSYVSQGIQTALRWRPRWKKVAQDLELGVRVHNDYIERDHVEDAFLMTSGVMVPEDSPLVQATLNRGEAVAAAFHLYDALTFWDRFTVAPGVRLEVISTRFSDELTDMRDRRLDVVAVPGIGAHVLATPWLGVFGGVHRGFSPVAPADQLDEVKPEFSINYEAGLRAAWKGLRAEAVGFLSDYSNLTGSCTFSSGCTDAQSGMQFNGGDVFVWGLESLVGYRHRFDSGFGLGGGVHYTYTGSRFRSDFRSIHPQFGDVSIGDELPYVPEHLAGGDVNVGGRIWDINAKLSYTGPMRDVPGQGSIPTAERIPGFVLLDLSAEVRFLRRFRVYGLLNNVTNNAYMASRRPFGPRPGAPLTFIFGVKIHIFN